MTTVASLNNLISVTVTPVNRPVPIVSICNINSLILKFYSCNRNEEITFEVTERKQFASKIKLNKETILRGENNNNP
jgi:hypothetical protein